MSDARRQSPSHTPTIHHPTSGWTAKNHLLPAGVGHVSFYYNSVHILNETFQDMLLGMIPFRCANTHPDGKIMKQN
jgi:hypothetical protein